MAKSDPDTTLRFSEAQLEAAVLRGKIEKLQEILNAGVVATKVGTYDTGEDKHQYAPDNEKIGAVLRQEFLRLAGDKHEALIQTGGEKHDYGNNRTNKVSVISELSKGRS